jgi:hypothetical protein
LSCLQGSFSSKGCANLRVVFAAIAVLLAKIVALTTIFRFILIVVAASGAHHGLGTTGVTMVVAAATAVVLTAVAKFLTAIITLALIFRPVVGGRRTPDAETRTKLADAFAINIFSTRATLDSALAIARLVVTITAAAAAAAHRRIRHAVQRADGLAQVHVRALARHARHGSIRACDGARISGLVAFSRKRKSIRATVNSHETWFRASSNAIKSMTSVTTAAIITLTTTVDITAVLVRAVVVSISALIFVFVFVFC